MQKGLNLENGMPLNANKGKNVIFPLVRLYLNPTTSRGLSSLALPFRASTRVSVCRLFFQICAVWAGLSLGAVWLYATLAQRDRSDGQIWKNVAR